MTHEEVICLCRSYGPDVRNYGCCAGCGRNRSYWSEWRFHHGLSLGRAVGLEPQLAGEQLWTSDWLLALGYTYWGGDDTASNHSVSFAPVFVYEFAGQNVRPYIEAGIGVAAFSSTELESNDLGSSFQFEDRIGVGLRFAGQEIGLRAIHYSNAGLKNPNDGAEAYTVHYRMSF